MHAHQKLDIDHISEKWEPLNRVQCISTRKTHFSMLTTIWYFYIINAKYVLKFNPLCFWTGKETSKGGRQVMSHMKLIQEYHKYHTLIRFIKILKLSLELTYRVITAAFERSSNISANNCKTEREREREKNIITHQSNRKHYNKSSSNRALSCIFFIFIGHIIKQAKFIKLLKQLLKHLHACLVQYSYSWDKCQKLTPYLHSLTPCNIIGRFQ